MELEKVMETRPFGPKLLVPVVSPTLFWDSSSFALLLAE